MFRHARALCGLAAAVAASTLGAGCASDQDFRPLDARRSTPSELAAAQYDLKADGEDLGDAKVWSKGSPQEQLNLPADAKRLLQIGLRIRNDSDAPLRLDLQSTDLEVHTEDGRMWIVELPVQVNGLVDVAPRGLQRVELIYELPVGVKMKDVVGYELAWAVEAGQRRISHSTVFRRAEDDRGYYYYYPYGGYPGGAWGAYPYMGFGARSGYWW